MAARLSNRARLDRPLPKVTPELLRAYREGNGHDVHVLCDLRPWEVNPLRVPHIPEPDPSTQQVFLQSWWRAKAIFDMLEAASGRRIITFELDDGDLR